MLGTHASEFGAGLAGVLLVVLLALLLRGKGM